MAHDLCKLPTPSQAHCATCHRTFGGVSGFDEHRRNGNCLDPAALGMMERDQIWRRVDSRSRPAHWRAQTGER